MKIAIFDTNWNYTLDTPYNEPLGGTQSSICYFLEEMCIQNNDVYLFNNISENQIIRGVKHIQAKQYQEFININKLEFDIIIVSCIPQELFKIKSSINNNNTMYCLWTGHDIDQNASKILKDDKAKDMIDLFIFVSEWQRSRYMIKYNINYKKTLIMNNGIGKPFEKYLDSPTPKIKNTLSYCSIPWRGLDLMPEIFNEVKKIEPSSKLEIYSGMNIYKQDSPSYSEKFKNIQNVIFNEGVSQVMLADKLSNIEYLTYPNIFPETSCITVLQAMACGCLIITSDLGALKETMGGLNEYVNINLSDFDKHGYILEFLNKFKTYSEMDENIKDKFREYNKIHIRNNYKWSTICKKFCLEINNIISSYKNYINNDHKNNINVFIKNFTDSKWVESIMASNKINYTINLNEYYIIKLNLGISYYKLNQLDEAKHCFKLCLELKNDYNINKNIALLELQRNNIKKFIIYAGEAISHEFDIELANLLAEKYELLGLYDRSISMYENIIFLDNENINCNNNLGNLNLLRISNIKNIDESINNIYKKSLDLCVQNNQHRKKELVLSNIIFNNLYNWKLSDEEIYNKSCEWSNYFPKNPDLLKIVDSFNKKECNSKIRVGYISCDFITHPVGFMFNSILKNHDTTKFEIYCYDCCDTGKKINDLLSNQLRNYKNASWRDLSKSSDAEGLKEIVDDKLDILVDMMGHTRNTRMNILQYKPAKIQISYFAYPSTNGLKEIDYRFTDKYASPPETQKYFVEKFYYLPNGFQCYTPPINIDSVKNYNRDSKYNIHLCCFNNPTKLSIPTIDTFCKVLKSLPNSKLFLRYCYYKSSYYKASILKLFTDRGIEKDRIDIGYEQIINALKMYDNIDIALDPFPYNGGTVSSESIYMNTPLITLEGTNYVSRVGVSLLSNLGLEKYIAKTTDEYVQKVVNLANNEDELKLLHQTLRIRMLKSDLANSVSFTKNVENAYTTMFNTFNT